MGTFRVDGDTASGRITLVSDGASPRDIQVGLRLALAAAYREGGHDISPDDLTLVGLAFTTAHEQMEEADRARRGYRRFMYWWLYPACAVNIVIATGLLARVAGWW